MNIAIIGHKRIPSREGGVEIVVEELATRMVACGHQVTVYNRRGGHVAGDEYSVENKREYKGIRIVNIPTFKNSKLNAIVYSMNATIHAMCSKYDVIHYHAEGPSIMTALARFTKKKIVVTIHGLDWQRSKWGGFATKMLLLGEKNAVKYADEIIVLSENVKKYFKDTYNRDTLFIPNGINRPEIIKADKIKSLYGIGEHNYILFLARIVPEKGLHYLLDAFSKINTDMKLVIAGGSSHTDEYFDKMKVKIAGDSRIIMTGFVQGEVLEELYSNAYLYVLPSDIEGMPISLLEALSYGNNCLVSDIPENELVKDLNYFEKSNVNDLKDKLEKLINDNIVVNRTENSQEVIDKYNWDDITNKTLEVYL